MRFHVDENVPAGVSAGLRRRGIDVTTTEQVGLKGASDAVQLAYAHSEGRVLVTQDSDFLVLAAQGQIHSGIAFWNQHSRTVGQVVRRLVTLHLSINEEEMRDRVEFL